MVELGPPFYGRIYLCKGYTPDLNLDLNFNLNLNLDLDLDFNLDFDLNFDPDFFKPITTLIPTLIPTTMAPTEKEWATIANKYKYGINTDKAIKDKLEEFI